MAKTPGTPKAKTAAPIQFDMNSRERKGGKGGPGGPGRNRDEKRPPSRIVNMPPTLVDRGEGWTIQKIGRVDQASHVAVGAEYQLIFEGHDPLVFEYLGAARDRAKEAPPEKPQIAEVAADPAEDAAAGAETPADEPRGECCLTHAEPDGMRLPRIAWMARWDWYRRVAAEVFRLIGLLPPDRQQLTGILCQSLPSPQIAAVVAISPVWP